MARGLGETTCLLSVCGEASNTRRCICELTRASVKPAAPLDSISTSTIASVHIRALTAQRRTMLTSPSCPSAWQPNPGRGSTYRRGNSVQRIGTTAAHRENQGRSLDPQKKPQENSYRIFYSLKYIPYTHSTCRIYSLLVPGILESRMSQETASVLGNSYRIFYSLKYIPYTHSTCRHGLARY